MDLGRDSVEFVCSRCAKIVARSSMHKHIKACKFANDPDTPTDQINAKAMVRHTAVPPPNIEEAAPPPAVPPKSKDPGVPAASGVKDTAAATVRKSVS